MRPYNFKVWAFPPDELSAEWVGDRAATSNLEKLIQNTKTQTDDVGWGPNSTFSISLPPAEQEGSGLHLPRNYPKTT